MISNHPSSNAKDENNDTCSMESFPDKKSSLMLILVRHVLITCILMLLFQARVEHHADLIIKEALTNDNEDSNSDILITGPLSDVQEQYWRRLVEFLLAILLYRTLFSIMISAPKIWQATNTH